MLLGLSSALPDSQELTAQFIRAVRAVRIEQIPAVKGASPRGSRSPPARCLVEGSWLLSGSIFISKDDAAKLCKIAHAAGRGAKNTARALSLIFKGPVVHKLRVKPLITAAGTDA